MQWICTQTKPHELKPNKHHKHNEKKVGILVAIIIPSFQCRVTTLTLDLFGLDKPQINKAKLEYVKKNIKYIQIWKKYNIYYTKIS